MAQVDWTILYNNQETNSAFEVFHIKTTEMYNEAFPKIKIKNVYYVKKTMVNTRIEEVSQNKEQTICRNVQKKDGI